MLAVDAGLRGFGVFVAPGLRTVDVTHGRLLDAARARRSDTSR